MFGLFSNKTKKTKREDDIIWQTEDIKIRNIILCLADYSQNSDSIMIVAHFPKTLENLKVAAKISNSKLRDLHTASDVDRWVAGYYK